MENKRKKKVDAKGITLVALVVTIVVLLILAGITIMYTMGENSVFKKAQDAKEKTEAAKEEEKKGIEILTAQMESAINNEVYAPEGSLLAMYRQAVKANCDNADGSCTRADHLHIGDYVDYKEPTTGSYPVATAKSGTDAVQTYTLSATKNNVNWRVLGIDRATGGVKLIAADPIQAGEADGSAPYLTLKGAEAYVYGPTEMDKICEMYKDTQYATKARSINMDDIDQITGVTTIEQKKATNFIALTGGSQIGTSYSVTGYTPENWLKKKAGDASIVATTLTGQTNAYGYPIFKTEEEANQIKSMVGEGFTAVVLPNTRIYNMLFANIEHETGKEYWLASRGVHGIPSNADFGPGGVFSGGDMTRAISYFYTFHSNGWENDVRRAVRPVVILRSDVLAENVGKLADQPGTWPGVN